MLGISANVAVHQLRSPSFLQEVADVLERTGLPATRLCPEITESAAFDDDRVSRDVLDAITRLGVHVALDDFGTGHSSLSLLKILLNR